MTVPIPSSEAQALAVQMLRSIDAHRRDRWDYAIVKEIERRDFWRRFFPWLKKLDRDDARLKIINDSYRRYSAQTPDMLFSRQEQVCRNVLRMSGSSDYITLTEEEFRCIA